MNTNSLGLKAACNQSGILPHTKSDGRKKFIGPLHDASDAGVGRQCRFALHHCGSTGKSVQFQAELHPTLATLAWHVRL